jgi:hypothetical protein
VAEFYLTMPHALSMKTTILDRISLPTRVVVQRLPLMPPALGALARGGELTAEGGTTCELESGGQVLARGRIVKRRGEYFFKVQEIGEERTT